MNISIKDYSPKYKNDVLSIFDQNCPTFFAKNEREDYLLFLESAPQGYKVVVQGGKTIAGFGLSSETHTSARLSWIMVSSSSKGQGVGKLIMEHIILLAQQLNAASIDIAASHLSAPFFQRFGAVEVVRQEHGWGPSMHRVDMKLEL